MHGDLSYSLAPDIVGSLEILADDFEVPPSFHIQSKTTQQEFGGLDKYDKKETV